MFAREALFIQEYLKTKHHEIYQEAVKMYNTINQVNPTKPDLRKTMEFRHWQNTFATANNHPLIPVLRQKQRSYNRTTYRDIPTDTTATSPQGIADSPHHIRPISPEKRSTDPRTTGKTMRLEIPLLQIPAAPKPVQPPNTILSEDTQEVMEEGDQIKDLHPSLIDELSPEILENLLNQLRADPELNTMMDTIETDIEKEQEETEEEIIGLTIDLPELYDPLEEEMMCW